MSTTPSLVPSIAGDDVQTDGVAAEATAVDSAAPAMEDQNVDGALLRRARPGDVPFIAQVLEMASRGHLERGPWDLIFPDDAERRRALEFIAGEASQSWCHHGLFHVAELDGRPCSALVTFEPGELGDSSLAAPLVESFAMLGFDEERVAAAGSRVAPVLACFPDMPAGTWIVENVGTREDARRRGLTRALLERALELGRRRGLATAQISCMIGNDSAQRAYERAGFEVVEERRDADFENMIGSPGFVRMTCALAAPE